MIIVIKEGDESRSISSRMFLSYAVVHLLFTKFLQRVYKPQNTSKNKCIKWSVLIGASRDDSQSKSSLTRQDE